MKKRSRNVGLTGSAQQRTVFNVFTKRAQRERKGWTFEKLEDRCYFSATPVSTPGVVSYSSNTPEGQQAILYDEMAWAVAQYAAQQGVEARGLTTMSLPNDPYFQYQWHLLNTGQLVGSPDTQDIFGAPGEDINVVPAWNMGYTGQGVVVAVVDTGTQTTHPDLIANLLPGFNALTGGTDPNPDLLDPANAHGTAVAGLIAAVGNNGIGTTGVAYGAKIVPINLIPGPLGGPETSNAFRFENQQIDIYNNSWGPADAGTRTVYSLSPLEEIALRDGTKFGRGGLGNIYVFSSGNDGGPTFSAGFGNIGDFDSASYNGYINSRYTIGVGGIDHDGSYNNIDGTVTDYMEAGPSILVAAPTGSNSLNITDDFGIGSGIWTTDALGDDGFNAAPLPNGEDIDLTIDHFADTNYTSRFNGTSAAAPLVSGVIALMLQANPQLSWRDVQEILVRSARQAGQFEIPETGGGIFNQNSWIVNPQALFTNPDRFPGFDPTTAPPTNAPPVMDPYNAPPTGVPGWTPYVLYPSPYIDTASNYDGVTGMILNYDAVKPPRPTMFANGAGYTVSQGRGSYGEQYGYGHGVVDATLAVQLAQQWTTKNQTLAPELTFTTYYVPPFANSATVKPAATATAIGNLTVPGGIGPAGPFIPYYNEYGNNSDMDPMDGPFSGGSGTPGTARGGFYHFEVPDSNAMDIESVELKLDITGPANSLDFMRITLISPDGTVSDMNDFFDIVPANAANSRQVPSTPKVVLDPPGAIAPTNNFVYTFRSNRNWGERYDTQPIIDPATGNPFLDSAGFATHQGWELHLENYSPDAFTINGLEMAWHGRPIEAATQRIQGSVGIDGGRNGFGAQDGFFNFDRYFQSIIDLDADGKVDINEVQRFADIDQEEFGANVTVKATRQSDGQVVAQFVTGADGNYYFDLVPDTYVISVDDPKGRTALQEQNQIDLTLPHYQAQWIITPDWFYAPQVDSSNPFDFRVVADNNNTPVAFQDGLGQVVPSGVKNVNFLLDPGVTADHVVINGQVFADIAGDGQFNGDDVAAPGFTVYIDSNADGQFENAEPSFVTGADGRYAFDVATLAPIPLTIGVVPLNVNWVPTNPASGRQQILAFPGDTTDNVNFAFLPPGANASVGAGLSGSVLGVVFSDKFDPIGRGTPADEPGVSGVRVFNDLDSNGTWSANEPYAMTQANGAYFLANVGPGNVRLTAELPTNYAFTTPGAGFQTVMLASGGAKTNILFGIRNQATRDFGDLAGYPTLLADNGPRHNIVPGFQLGAKIDGELNGQPTADAKGDDAVMGDEDGVVVASNGGKLQPGTNTIRVTVQGVGGLLNGWIDWNNDGDWNDAGEQVFVNRDLNPGTFDLTVSAPANMAGGPLAARFRWGSANISYVGADIIGEVEDYRLANALPPMLSQSLPGDYNHNGSVENTDYDLWKSTFGSISDLRADGNGNGKIDAADYTVWRNHKGESGGAGSALVDSESDPAAARAAAYARAVGALSQPLGSEHWGPGAAAAAQLAASGALPLTIRVGNGTQTVYYFPSSDVTTSPPAAGQSIATTSAIVTTATAPTDTGLHISLAGLQFSTEVSPHASAASLAPASSSAATAQDAAALQLLDEVWSAVATDVDIDSLPLSIQAADDSHDAFGLALASLFDDDGKLPAGI